MDGFSKLDIRNFAFRGLGIGGVGTRIPGELVEEVGTPSSSSGVKSAVYILGLHPMGRMDLISICSSGGEGSS